MPKKKTDGYLTIEQAATRAGRSRNWVYTQIKEKRLTLYKVGARSRVNAAELAELVRERSEPRAVDAGRRAV